MQSNLSKTNLVLVAVLRILIGLFAAWTVAVYFFDFLPQNIKSTVGQSYITPIFWFFVTLVILYSQKFKAWICHSIDNIFIPFGIKCFEDFKIGLRVKPDFLPFRIVLMCSVIAAITVAIDIVISLHYGILSGPMQYDGVDYTMDAERIYYGLQPIKYALDYPHFIGFGPRSWAWIGSMLFSFQLFGCGDWQAATARFWPTFILLTTVAWIAYRRNQKEQIWLYLIFTALIPIVSPGLRSLVWEFLSKREVYEAQWYLDDLRPDFYNSVLQIAACVIALEQYKKPSIINSFIAGGVAGFALFVKASGSSGTVLTIGLICLSLIILNRNSLSKSVGQIIAVLISFSLCASIWVAIGGLDWTQKYLGSAFSHPEIWGDPNGSYLKSFIYYIELMWFELGQWETVLAAGIWGLAFFKIFDKSKKPIDELEACYFLISLVNLIGISAVPSLNYFVGYTSYLFMLISLVAVFSSNLPQKLSSVNLNILCVGYASVIILIAIIGAISMPNLAKTGPDDMKVIRSLSQVLGNHIGPDDHYLCDPFYGAPQLLTDVMISNANLVAKDIGKQQLADYPLETGTWQERVNQVKAERAIICYDQRHSVYTPYLGLDPVARWEGEDDVKKIVRDPSNGFYLFAKYNCSPYMVIEAPPSGHGFWAIVSTPAGRPWHQPLTLDLYLKK